MNRATFIGNLTRDPETRTIQKLGNETTVTNFTVAASHGFGDYKHVEFIRISAWNGLGKTCAQYLQKGNKVFVAGPVTPNAYINSEGVAVGGLELRLEEIEFLNSKSGEQVDQTEKVPAESPSDDDIDALL